MLFQKSGCFKCSGGAEAMTEYSKWPVGEWQDCLNRLFDILPEVRHRWLCETRFAPWRLNGKGIDILWKVRVPVPEYRCAPTGVRKAEQTH